MRPRGANLRLLLCLALLGGVTVASAEPFNIDAPVDSAAAQQQLITVNRRILDEPRNARLLTERGETYFQLRQFDKAIADFNGALAVDPDYADAYFGRGMALGRMGKMDEGIADIGKFLARNPNSSIGYTKRGVRYLWKGDFARAEADLGRAIEINPENAEAHDDLGVILARRQDYAAAVEHFEKTIQFDSTYQKAYHNLAMVSFIVGRPQDALTLIDAALKLSPDSRNTLLLKSRILASLGRTQEAKVIEDDAAFLPEANWTERASVK